MICEEEIKEAVLLYAFCLDAESDSRSASESGIKTAIDEASGKLELHCRQGLSRDYHAGLLGIKE